MLTCLRKIVVDNLPRLAYNATTRLERVANADMAELADAHGSGPCESSLIQVGVLLSALKNSLEINVPGLFSFSAAFPSQNRVAEKNIGARA